MTAIHVIRGFANARRQLALSAPASFDLARIQNPDDFGTALANDAGSVAYIIQMLNQPNPNQLKILLKCKFYVGPVNSHLSAFKSRAWHLSSSNAAAANRSSLTIDGEKCLPRHVQKDKPLWTRRRSEEKSGMERGRLGFLMQRSSHLKWKEFIELSCLICPTLARWLNQGQCQETIDTASYK